MNKRKIVSVVAVIAILAAAAATYLLNQYPIGPEETNGQPSNGNQANEEIPQEPVKKPKFHMFDISTSPYEPYPIVRFHMQNLGDANATNVVVTYQVKLGGNDVEYNWRNGTITTFFWYVGNSTIPVIEAKEVNEYFIGYDLSDYTLELGIKGGKQVKNAEVLESHWNLSCDEGIIEDFDF